jgi:hypothetical protein
MSEQRPTTTSTKTADQNEPDDSEPTPERQAELRAAYEANVAAGRAPYADVSIYTRGELRWVLRERHWWNGDEGHWRNADDEGDPPANLSGTVFRGANLTDQFLGRANLSGANLFRTNLSGARLIGSNLSGADLYEANLRGAGLVRARMDPVTTLIGIKLNSRTTLGDVVWNGVSLTLIDWDQAPTLGDELGIPDDHYRYRPHPESRAEKYREAAQAYRGLSITLRSQGLLIPASNYRLREQVLERKASFEEGKGKLLGWVFSWLLFLVAGYGERPARSLVAYLLVLFGFAAAFLTLGSSALGIGTHDAIKTPLAALVFSVTSFHGRGFFPGGLTLDDPITVLAAIEAVLGLFIEITFIATFTQRFFSSR